MISPAAHRTTTRSTTRLAVVSAAAFFRVARRVQVTAREFVNGPTTADEKKAFSRADRVRRRGAFRRIQNHGERTHTRHFIIVQHAGRDTSRSRLGITVTKKIGNAPERNRVKRLVREAFRLHRGLFVPGIDAVFIAKRGAPELTLAAVVAELHKAKNALHRSARRALAAGSKEKAAGF